MVVIDPYIGVKITSFYTTLFISRMCPVHYLYFLMYFCIFRFAARRHSYSFNGSYASGGRRGGGGNYFNSGYPYEFSGGSNRRNFNGNNNQPRKSYDGYRELVDYILIYIILHLHKFFSLSGGRNTDGCFRGRNFGAREDNF